MGQFAEIEYSIVLMDELDVANTMDLPEHVMSGCVHSWLGKLQFLFS